MTAMGYQFTGGGNYLHYNLERVDFAVSDGELKNLEEGAETHWTHFCIGCLGVGIPCLINAIVCCEKMEKFAATLEFNINLVIGLVGIVLGTAFGFAWYRTTGRIHALVAGIRARPKIRIPDYIVTPQEGTPTVQPTAAAPFKTTEPTPTAPASVSAATAPKIEVGKPADKSPSA